MAEQSAGLRTPNKTKTGTGSDASEVPVPVLYEPLRQFGWDQFFAQHFPTGDGLIPARVVAEHRSHYRVQTAVAERSACIAGKLRHRAACPADLPAVGDWVAVQSPAGDGDLVIHDVLPRRSKFSRKVAGERTEEQVVAANVDYVWIVTALDGDFNLRRLERYLTLAWESGASPVIVLNKADLAADAAKPSSLSCTGTRGLAQFVKSAEQIVPVPLSLSNCARPPRLDGLKAPLESLSPGTPVHSISSLTGEGLGDLACYLQNHATVALLGSSGVGKSTLINALAGTILQETGAIRGDGKGRHTTTGRQLIRLPGGGLIVDTPGMRELQLWDAGAGLADTFRDIDELAAACRFSDCQHAEEPGCAVTAAVEQGLLPPERLASYQKLQRELAHLDRKQDARARHLEKQRNRSITKSLRDHPKYKRRDGR